MDEDTADRDTTFGMVGGVALEMGTPGLTRNHDVDGIPVGDVGVRKRPSSGSQTPFPPRARKLKPRARTPLIIPFSSVLPPAYSVTVLYPSPCPLQAACPHLPA